MPFGPYFVFCILKKRASDHDARSVHEQRRGQEEKLRSARTFLRGEVARQRRRGKEAETEAAEAREVEDG